MAIVTMPGRGGNAIVQCSEGCVKPLPARCSAKCFRAPMIIGAKYAVPERSTQSDPRFGHSEFDH